MLSVEGGERKKPGSGSLSFNDHQELRERKRECLVVCQKGNQILGELAFLFGILIFWISKYKKAARGLLYFNYGNARHMNGPIKLANRRWREGTAQWYTVQVYIYIKKNNPKTHSLVTSRDKTTSNSEKLEWVKEKELMEFLVSQFYYINQQ